MFFLDFFNRRSNVAVNAPVGYELSIVAPGGLAGPLRSMEALNNLTPHPGLEKFSVVEKVRCSLARRGHPVYLFDMPSRTRVEVVAIGQAVRFR
ncbi:hypothetical protein B0H19DRAFT_1130128 [Mycena capillaripes]|nr:hypothetical protein B0H19DRAFT_1130128 [Mycena capillaripes]